MLPYFSIINKWFYEESCQPCGLLFLPVWMIVCNLLCAYLKPVMLV